MDVKIDAYKMDDVDELYRVINASAKHLRPWMPWCHGQYNIEDTRTWVSTCVIEWKHSMAFRYLVRGVKSGAIVGAVGLDQIDRSHGIAQLGYWVASNTLNQNVATNAAKLAVHNAFCHHGLNRIEINVLPHNVASNRVAEKLGAQLEGTFRNKLFHNGASHSANGYSLVPGDLPAS